MKFSEVEDAGERQIIRSIISDDLAWLREYFTKVGVEIRRLILFLNAGSAAALMTYMGASQEVRAADAAWTALALFGLGLFFLCASYAIGFHLLSWLMQRSAALQRAVFNDELSVLEYDAKRLALPKWVPRLSKTSLVANYSALACWLAGVIVAIVYLRPDASPACVICSIWV